MHPACMGGGTRARFAGERLEARPSVTSCAGRGVVWCGAVWCGVLWRVSRVHPACMGGGTRARIAGERLGARLSGPGRLDFPVTARIGGFSRGAGGLNT